MKKNVLFFALGGLLLTSAGLVSCEYLVKEDSQGEEEVVQDDAAAKSSEADAIESGDAEDVESSAVLDETQNTASAEEGDEVQDASQETTSE